MEYTSCSYLVYTTYHFTKTAPPFQVFILEITNENASFLPKIRF